MAMDGRSPTNSDAICKAITGVLKAVDSMPKRLFTVLRRSYTNIEFAKGGYAAPKRKSSLHPQAPDPLENAYIIVTKEFVMPHRESPVPAVVLDNFCRGWQGMDMKSRMDHGFTMVSPSVHQSLQNADEKDNEPEVKTEDGRSLMSPAKGDGEDNAEAGQAPLQGEVQDEGGNAAKPDNVPLAPWENSELHSALLIDLYKGDEGVGNLRQPRVVVLEASLSLGIAACRKHMRTTMYVVSDRHKQLIWQALMLRITFEIMSGCADGFIMRSRILSRENSLTGSESRPPLPSPTAPTTASERPAADDLDQDDEDYDGQPENADEEEF